MESVSVDQRMVSKYEAYTPTGGDPPTNER